MRQIRSLYFIVLLMLILNLLVFPVHAEYGGTCGDTATWSLSNSGVLTISGTGAIKNYIYEGYETWPNLVKAPWRTHAEKITRIVIDYGITSIGQNAFCELPNLQSVSMPNSLTQIGKAAFCNDKQLNNVTIPNSVSTIKDSAFRNCHSLTNIALPSNLKALEYSTFEGCVNLKTIALPNSLTEISGYTFAYCRSLSNLTIPESVAIIETHAFDSCSSLSTLKLPSSLREIKPQAFWYCGLSQITFPTSVTYIGQGSFEGTKLKYIEFKGNAPSFDSHVFQGLTATAYYPSGNETWSATVRKDYGGTITWVSYCPNGHTWKQWSTQREASCSVAGLQVRNCSQCDMTEEQSIAKLAHQYTESITPPTCKDDGYTTLTCKVCNYSYTDNITPKGPHVFEEWIITKEATCMETGIRQHTCSICQLQESEETELGDHTYQSVITPPSCTKKGFTTHSCALCGHTATDTYTEIIPHAYDEWNNITFATWFTEGKQERVCLICSAIETQSIPQWPIEGFIIIIAIAVIVSGALITIAIIRKKKRNK